MKDFRCDFGPVCPEWDDERAAAVFAGIAMKKRRRAAIRGMVSAVVVVSVAIAVILAMRSGNGDDLSHAGGGGARVQPVSMPVETLRPPIPIATKDGSTATPVDDDSQLVAETVTDTYVAIRIRKGGGRFDVTPDVARVFEVRLDDVTVSVLGTAFEVRALQDAAWVSVTEGRVRVTWPGGTDELAAGKAQRYPRQDTKPSGGTTLKAVGEDSSRQKAKRGSDWRAHAEHGDFARASSILLRQPDVKDTVEDLLLAADAMRLSKRPAEAVRYLARVVRDHSSDPRAALAAFTRGRILLHQLNRPKEAAAAFLNVRRLSPKSSLAEDALAREVESLHKAGDAAAAKARAEAYMSAYPEGRRLDAVRRFGQLER